LKTNSGLKTLALNKNNIDNDGAVALINALNINTVLTTLNLIQTQISESKITEIGNLLTRDKISPDRAAEIPVQINQPLESKPSEQQQHQQQHQQHQEPLHPKISELDHRESLLNEREKIHLQNQDKLQHKESELRKKEFQLTQLEKSIQQKEHEFNQKEEALIQRENLLNTKESLLKEVQSTDPIQREGLIQRNIKESTDPVKESQLKDLQSTDPIKSESLAHRNIKESQLKDQSTDPFIQRSSQQQNEDELTQQSKKLVEGRLRDLKLKMDEYERSQFYQKGLYLFIGFFIAYLCVWMNIL